MKTLISLFGKGLFMVFVLPIVSCFQRKQVSAPAPVQYRRQYRDAPLENSQTRSDRRRYR